ncbi:MAG TPA: CoB--CoM heterodisulfide reductase iron-sulfur subunit B family protein [Candidatus Krumholzibacteriaceae bacterium]|nr:CoB--CoM heterodisulfide reductase iron-sulfur subunit B family protein [Candidatus Krumholzibacteriaceae bacterium]
MKYAFFVGCTTLSRLPGYEKSARKVAEKLGVELLDMPGSGCCGTTYLETLDHKTALAMAARNIAIAEEMGLDIVTVCNGCTEVLTKTNKELKGNPELKAEINEVLAEAGKKYMGTVEVKHYVKMLKDDVGLDAIKEKMERSLSGLKVGSHYGCHMFKPAEVMEGEDPENPTVMDELVALTGAEPIEYPNKLECCAGPVMGVRENVTWSVGLDKVKTVKKYGDTLATACPFCYLTFERCQLMEEESPGLPVIHLPQLLGLAMGLDADDVGLGHNKVDAKGILEKLR